MSLLGPLEKLIPQPDPEKRDFKSGLLEIRDKTIKLGDNVYSIANIASISVLDLRTPVPWIFWLLLGVAALAVMYGGRASFAAVPALYCALAVFIKHWLEKSAADFKIVVSMNSGGSASIFSDEQEFLSSIAAELYGVIELGIPSHAAYNIDQNVRLEGVAGSPIIVSGVASGAISNVLAGAQA
ncbi:hypothetical protein HNQ61_000388 [Longimicrobium terrae]|uniref:Uncharacterized protein n=2 Tax=Longimicrobium terrae TaxID=1639882 RepID=A0A841GJN4_9BACT|nr:hypothetical protein [Longimicrobium terrae]